VTSPDGGAPNSAEAALAAMLEESHLAAAHDLPALARRHVAAFGGLDVVCYLADLQQMMLVPFLGNEGPDIGQLVEPVPVDTTLAGRAYQHSAVLSQQRGEPNGRATLWIPLLDGTERLGVAGVAVEHTDADVVDGPLGRQLRRFASMLAELIMTKTMYGDSVVRLRRRAQMGLAAELQWSLLPPLTFACREVTVAATLEPAYEVAGDTVDYAVDDRVAKVGVFDGMGHGLRSAQLAVMAVSAYRHARRSGRSLEQICAEIDETLLDSFAGTSFTTAVLAELDTKAGTLRWINAGHPPPLLLRHGRLVKTLEVRPRPPLGMDLTRLGGPFEVTVGVEDLEPGDCVLIYTDGVVEARSPDGEFFGEQRLVDLTVRNMAAGLPAPETMRRVVRELLAHQQGRLTDDATLLLMQWPSEVEALLP
jgi:Stage II sporulation protein E (SpoIIE)